MYRAAAICCTSRAQPPTEQAPKRLAESHVIALVGGRARRAARRSATRSAKLAQITGGTPMIIVNPNEDGSATLGAGNAGAPRADSARESAGGHRRPFRRARGNIGRIGPRLAPEDCSAPRGARARDERVLQQ